MFSMERHETHPVLHAIFATGQVNRGRCVREIHPIFESSGVRASSFIPVGLRMLDPANLVLIKQFGSEGEGLPEKKDYCGTKNKTLQNLGQFS